MTDQPDYLGMLDALQPWREMLRGSVAMLTADGFSDEQARSLVTAAVTAKSEPRDPAGQHDDEAMRFGIITCDDCMISRCAGHDAAEAIEQYGLRIIALQDEVARLKADRA